MDVLFLEKRLDIDYLLTLSSTQNIKLLETQQNHNSDEGTDDQTNEMIKVE